MKQRMLVMLDCLLDTRLAVIEMCDPKIAQEIISDPKVSKKYRTRLNDDFSVFGIDQKKYLEKWNKRTADVFPLSVMTPFPHMLANIMDQVNVESVLSPHEFEDFELHLNVWPYIDLTQEECDLIVEMVNARFKVNVNIKFINVPLENLTPELILGLDYTSLYLYNWEDWVYKVYPKDISILQKNPDSYRLPGVTVHTTYQPTNIESLKTAFEFKSPSGEQMAPHLGIAFLMRDFMILEFVGIEHYSAIDPELHVAFTAASENITA